jgi:hypothetical protein
LSNPELKPEVYDNQLNIRALKLKWISGSTANEFKVYQNRPNPFSISTVIPYQLPQNSWVNLKIFDVDGRIVSSNKVFSAKGLNTWTIDRSKFNVGGIYYYKVETPFGTHANKMIVLQ